MVAGSLAISLTSLHFRDHRDGVARALLETDGTTRAVGVIELIATAWSEFDDCVFGTSSITVVALEAIAAGKTPLRLIARLLLRKTCDHFLNPPIRSAVPSVFGGFGSASL